MQENDNYHKQTLTNKKRFLQIRFGFFFFIVLYITIGAFIFQLFEDDFRKKKCFENKRADTDLRFGLRQSLATLIMKKKISKSVLIIERSSIKNLLLNFNENYKSLLQRIPLYTGVDCSNDQAWKIVNSILFAVSTHQEGCSSRVFD